MPLPGSDKYRIAPVPKKMTWEQHVIHKAKQDVKIEDVLQRFYNIQVPYDAISWKVRCPYALEHEDGGLDKQFRIYSESNTGYCFAMHGRIDTLRLYRDINPFLSYFEAAKSLLDDFDIDYRKKSYREVYEEIIQERGLSIDFNNVVDAMKLYLSTFSLYREFEYDSVLVDAINVFNQQAKSVCMSASSLQEVEEWYLLQKENLKHLLLSLNG